MKMGIVPNAMMLVGNANQTKFVKPVCTIMLKFKTHAFCPFKVATCTFQIKHARRATLSIISMKMVNAPKKPIPIFKQFHATKIIFLNTAVPVVHAHQ